MREQDIRTAALIGEAGLNTLRNSTVAVFGIGGVGSYAVEALARSGVGELWLYDDDTVAPSNLNRQLIALNSTLGEYKTAIAARRCRDINPDIKTVENPVFVTPQTPIPFEKFDYIIDAVDNVTAKLFLIQNAAQQNIPIISVMGTGNKTNPELLQIGDIYATKECPLCRVMRYELKKREIKSLTVVWSPERPIKFEDCTEKRETGRPTPASMIFVPASAGILAASHAVKEILKK